MSDIYVVMGINMIVWAGIFGYIFSLHSKVTKLKARLDEKLSEK